MFIFFELIFLAIPMIIVLLFIIGLIGYFTTKNEMNKHPERNLENRLTVFKILSITFGVFTVIFVVVAIGFYILLNRAIAYM